MPKPTLLYTAAHGGFNLARVPLGGAAAVCAQLAEAWKDQDQFDLQLVTPNILGREAPHDKDLVRYSERRYARFCFDFERASTLEILRHDPAKCIILSNDISEGPGFRPLAIRGYRLYTIYHVNVVDYFSAIYLKGAARPETLTALHRGLDRSGLSVLMPNILKLVFQKQQDSILYSKGVIVPSEGMKRILMRSYPAVDPAKIHVLPWGSSDPKFEEATVAERTAELRQRYGIPENGRVLLTLSRISPEKGQDRLLQALQLWEQQGNLPEEGLWVLICGEAAYMQGQRFRQQLGELAKTLKSVRVIFPGYVAGVDKEAHFRLADLYVFPSRHESYGLTLLEAFRAGLPALACRHYGAEDLLRPEFGRLLPAAPAKLVPPLLMEALQQLLAEPAKLKVMGTQAQAFARQSSFQRTAAQLAKLLNLSVSAG